MKTITSSKNPPGVTNKQGDKIDLVRGPRSASKVINKTIEYLPVDTLRSLLDLPPLEAKTPTIEPSNPPDTTTTQELEQ